MTDTPASPSALKAQIREQALARRDRLDAGWREEVSHALAEGFDIAPWRPLRGLVVSGFWPIRSEIDPRPLMRRFAREGADLALPCVEAGRLVFRAHDFGDRLVARPFGLSEPARDAAQVRPDILIVPLAAFDRQGGRIGYGRGFYDRALTELAAAKRIRTIGLCFAVQEVDAVPMEPHDRRLEAILTETGLIHASA
jgi:5-formyltetrahydrofolate cyclo-ligase